MGTFTRKELFKTVRLVEMEGNLHEIDANAKTGPILATLEKERVAVDVGFKIKFVPPKCPVCFKKLYRADVVGEEDEIVQVRLFCTYCLWTEEMPK